MIIKNLERIKDSGWRLFKFSVYLDGMDMEIHNMTLCQSKQGKRYVQFPQFVSEKDFNGKPKFASLIVIGERRKKEFDNEILRLVEQKVKEFEVQNHQFPEEQIVGASHW